MENAVRKGTAWLNAGLALVNTVVAVAKVSADVRTHGAHDEHGRDCRCLSNCVRCISDGLLGR